MFQKKKKVKKARHLSKEKGILEMPDQVRRKELHQDLLFWWWIYSETSWNEYDCVRCIICLKD